MSAKINSVGIAIPKLNAVDRNSSIKLSVAAMQQALDQAGIAANDLGLLLSNATFKEDNLAEPALAALVQKAVGANLIGSSQSSTFSFDISDSAGGAITGLELIAGFIETNEIENGVVVCSDVNPDEPNTVGFGYSHAASAILLGPAQINGEGFQYFKQFDYPQYRRELATTRAFQNHPHDGTLAKRNILTIEESPSFAHLASECSAEALQQFAQELELSLDDIDLIVTSLHPASLAKSLVRTLNLPPDKIVDLGVEDTPFYTAGFGVALESVFYSDKWAAAKSIVFLGVSSGIKVSLAFYKNV